MILWHNLAEIAAKYLADVPQIMVEGKLKYPDWAGHQGANRFIVKFRAFNMLVHAT